MTANYHLFKSLVTSLLETKTKEEEVVVAQSLSVLYEKLLSTHIPNKAYANTQNTHIDGGIALSSQDALNCLKDPLRTVRFIKGTYQAIQKAMEQFPQEKIELLYAGCGPAAPIITPLLCLLQPKKISITLIDINPTSITSVKKLIQVLGAQDFFRNYELTDATLYQHPKEFPLHIIVSETMDKGFSKEPQIRITQNLAPQLHKKGLLIPESIDLYAEHIFYSKEPYFDIYKNVLELGEKTPVKDTQRLFSITKGIYPSPEFTYLSPIIEVPQNFTETPDISVFAEVSIFENQKLLKSESLISNPYCITSLYNLTSKTYQLKYTTKGIPNWEVIEV
ncbi:MAG: hypothetical protein R2776_03950 [Flavobacteriaceae bacterium]|nr:hypothetical protein [Flavobacteriaceae bacterium]